MGSISKAEITKAAREVRQALSIVEKSLKAGAPVDPELFLVIHGSTSILEDIANEPELARQVPLEMAPIETCERNSKKPSKDQHDNRCRICNNPVVAEKAWHIHENANGDSIWRADLGAEETGNDTYGWQPIGPECAKKIPAAYRSRS